MGIADRDYSKFTDAERRAYYGETSLSKGVRPRRGVGIAIAVSVLASIVWHYLGRHGFALHVPRAAR